MLNARTTDPETSKDAGRQLTTGTLAMRLLAEFAKKSMTAEMAGIAAGLLGTGYWKRVSDLKRDGYLIERRGPDGCEMRWPTTSGRHGVVLKITESGRDLLRWARALEKQS